MMNIEGHFHTLSVLKLLGKSEYLLIFNVDEHFSPSEQIFCNGNIDF